MEIATMPIYSWVIVAFWLVLLVIWVITAGGAPRTRDIKRIWRREITLRLVMILIVILALHYFRHTVQNLRSYGVTRNPVAGLTGIALCALGLGLSIVARLYLGRNWGMPMSRKENPLLVTAGPYAIVRHPIYGGLLLGMLGSAVGQSIFWLLPLVLFGPYFIYSAKQEEKFLAANFPSRYPAYRKRTNMLLPWLL